ncbi:MAG: hypothetical protein IPK13_03295 [Deltaproteobacteria bacterium]|nr:hypothetical protein [Deltaproteobacteria bacterium]
MAANVSAYPGLSSALVNTASAAPANGAHPGSALELSFEQTDLEGTLLQPEESRSWLKRNAGKVAATAVGAVVLARAGYLGLPAARAFAQEAPAASKLKVAGQFLGRTFDLRHWTKGATLARASGAATEFNAALFKLSEAAEGALTKAFTGFGINGERSVVEYIEKALSTTPPKGYVQGLREAFSDPHRSAAIAELRTAAPEFVKHVEEMLGRTATAA